MDEQSAIASARSLEDSNGNVEQFLAYPAALQIRIDALWRSGKLSPKKAIYIIQKSHSHELVFPLELAAPIFLQFKFDGLSSQDKLDFVKSFFSESEQEITNAIARGILDDQTSISGLIVSRDPSANESAIFKFQMIADNIGPIALLAHDNWDQWLERIAEICALTIDYPGDPKFDDFLNTAARTFKETLSLVSEADRHKLNARLSGALFRHFPGENEEQLQKVVALSAKLGIVETEKNIHWQHVLQNPKAEAIDTFAKLFQGEPPNALAKFVTRSLSMFPDSSVHSGLGYVLANLMNSKALTIETRKAIVGEISSVRNRFGEDKEEPTVEFDAADRTIRGLILSLASTRKTKNYPDSQATYTFLEIPNELRDCIVAEFKNHYTKELIESRFLDDNDSLALAAEWIGADVEVVDRLTSSPNGLELLDSLRQQRTGIPSVNTQLQNQKSGFQSDAGQAWQSRR
jgi:hypothetical protein